MANENAATVRPGFFRRLWQVLEALDASPEEDHDARVAWLTREVARLREELRRVELGR